MLRVLASEAREPRPGFATFTADALAAWREVNTAADFKAAAAALHPLVGSLPLLLHHRVGALHPLGP